MKTESGVSENVLILLPNLLQSSRSTFPCEGFLSFFAFKEGMSIARSLAEEYPGSPREMHTSAHPRCVRACMREDSTMRLSTIGFMFALALAIVVAPLATEAQPARLPTIGVLVVGAPSSDKFGRLFRDGMRDLGY